MSYWQPHSDPRHTYTNHLRVCTVDVCFTSHSDAKKKRKFKKKKSKYMLLIPLICVRKIKMTKNPNATKTKKYNKNHNKLKTPSQKRIPKHLRTVIMENGAKYH